MHQAANVDRENTRAIFATTRWTVVLGAAKSDSETVEALEQLCRAYWPPLYAFLRGHGHAPAEAEDLVQGFFERFLAKDYLRDVSPDKGRFRSFLLASLRHYAANVRRDGRTGRRGGSIIHTDVDEPAVVARCEAALSVNAPPEMIFDRVWAETVMNAAAQRLRIEFANRGQQQLYDTLRGWLAREARPGEYAAVGTALGLSEGAVAVAVHRLRQRFRELIHSEVAHTVQLPADVDNEMRYLLQVLTAA